MNENPSPNQPITNFTPSGDSNTVPPISTNNFTPLPAPTPASSSMSSRKWLIIAGAIVGSIVIVVAALLIPRIFGGPDYGESYRLSAELEDKFDEMWGSTKSSCAAMTHNATYNNVTPTDYAQYIDKCQQDLVKIWDISNELGKSSGINKDSDLKQKFATFEKSLNTSLPAKNNLEQMKKTFAAIHEFAIRLDTIGPESTEADVNAAAKVLIDSGSNDWANFGREWQNRMLKLLEAHRAYQEIKYSDPQYDTVRQEFYDALDSIDNYLDNMDSEEWDNGGFHTKAIDELEENFYTLHSAIRDIYGQNYDGKNPEKCTDFGDGEAYCD